MSENSNNNEQGFSEHQAGAFHFSTIRDENRGQPSRLQQLLSGLPAERGMPVWPVAALCLAIGFALGYFAAAPDYQQQVSSRSGPAILGNANQISLQERPHLKQWHELNEAEKVAIKAAALRKFPQINRIGEGVSWKPVTEWLAEEKGVIHTNPRDLFR